MPQLRRSLAAYRLAIGQPRQEELVDYLERTYSQDQIRELLDELRVDLTPPVQPTRYIPSALASREADTAHAGAKPAIVALDRVMQELATSGRELVKPVLEELAARGCQFERPTGARQDYVNVRPPKPYGDAVLATVTLATGGIELQGRSWRAVVKCNARGWFDEVAAGEKAAITITSIGGAHAALQVIEAYLEQRRTHEQRRHPRSAR